MDGWLNIYKPCGISSAKLVSRVKHILKGTKIGHAGTLDVEAEGVLPLAIGEATKLVSFLMDAKKKYVFTIKFGFKTDTADHAGKIIKTTEHIPTSEECYQICNKFVGKITQVPPAFSAIKIDGVRAYKLARENMPVEIKPREIEIFYLNCLAAEKGIATYEAECSKGTYIRTLAEDIALSLQSLGFVIELRRLSVGSFFAEQAINSSVLEGQSQNALRSILKQKSLKVEAVLDDIPVLDATSEQAQKIRFGQKCYFSYDQDYQKVWVRHNGRLLAIGSISSTCFNSLRVFNLE